jgi:hypothetical protein
LILILTLFDFWIVSFLFTFTPTQVWVQNGVGQISPFQRKNQWVRVVYTNPQLAALKQSKEPGLTLGCQF